MKVGSLNGFSASFQDRVLIRRLKWQSDVALPDSVAEALNETADAITMLSRLNVQRRLTVRTKFTTNSIRTKNRARGRNAARMFARTGTISKYLPIQNVGGVVRAPGQSHAIPTVVARTGRKISGSVATRYRLNRMGNWGSGGKFFAGRPSGGNRPNGVWQRMRNGKLRLIRRLGHPTVRVPASRWFTDAINSVAPTVNQRFKRAAQRRLGAQR